MAGPWRQHRALPGPPGKDRTFRHSPLPADRKPRLSGPLGTDLGPPAPHLPAPGRSTSGEGPRGSADRPEGGGARRGCTPLAGRPLRHGRLGVEPRLGARLGGPRHLPGEACGSWGPAPSLSRPPRAPAESARTRRCSSRRHTATPAPGRPRHRAQARVQPRPQRPQLPLPLLPTPKAQTGPLPCFARDKDGADSGEKT